MRSPPSHDAAVSPAIGTILLVALTVVFVAVAAVVAMGLADGMFNMKQVGLTLKPYAVGGDTPEHGIGFIVHGGADAGDLVSLSAVITGPELTYAKTKNNSVEGPQVGQEYRMAAYVDPAVISALKKNKYNAILTTDGKAEVAALDCYVTVTGKFRDGTEQVLLVQRVVIPAIPGTEGGIAGDYVSVIPYYIKGIYPGHGFIVNILNDSITGLGTVKFKTLNPSGEEKNIDLTNNKDPNKDGQKQYTYDINTKGSGSGDGWHLTPYPEYDKENKFWLLGTLTGNVTIELKSTTDSNLNEKKIELGPITILPRINIFTDTANVSGSIKYDNTAVYFTPDKNKKNPNTDNKNFAYFFIGSGNPEELSIKKISSWTDTANLRTEISVDDLNKKSEQTLEAYVRVKVEGTEVWYRVASIPVSDLL